MNYLNRLEGYLKKIAGDDAVKDMNPGNRIEHLLDEISKNSGGEGGGSGNYATEKFVEDYVDEQFGKLVNGNEVAF